MEKTLKLQKLQQKLEYKRRVEQYISLFDTVCQISPYYPCPPECRAYCCKITPINFSRIAYNKVGSLGEKYKRIMETETETIPKEFQHSVRSKQHVEVRRFKSEVCPLLENNICSIYDCRPAMCRPYPFRQNESCGFDVVICPSGLDIILDNFTVSMLRKALNVQNKEILAETITIKVNNIIPIHASSVR